MKQVLGISWVLLALLSSCHRSGQRQPPKAVALPEAADWSQKRQVGVDFVAAGRVPDWSMDIDFSKSIRLSEPTGITLVAAIPKPQHLGASSGVLLEAKASRVNAAGDRRSALSRPSRLRVAIEPTVYHDETAQRDYAYTVRVEAGNRRYVGWGAFIKGSERLNGSWVLESYQGQRFHTGQFLDQQLPTLDIDLKANKVRGSTGYNTLKGDLSAEGDHIRFVVDAAKRHTCPTSFEANFLTSLRNATLFRIGKDRLTLLASGQYVMTLRKADK